MARITVEDCAKIIPNRFELVAIAAQRTKMIASGSEVGVERDNDKTPVIALREIASKKVDINKLRDAIIQNCQEKTLVDQYGVAEVINGEEVGLSSDEIIDDIKSYQADIQAQSADDLLFSEENLDGVDD